MVVVCSASAWGCTSTDAREDGESERDSSEESSAPGASPSDSMSASPTDGAGESWRSVDVVDGDTLDVAGPGGEITVRLIGINTPESGECFSDEATAALAELVAGEELVLVADRSDIDQFGRALRYVQTADGVDVGADLVARGFAIARRYPPDEARADAYLDLQGVAQAERRGLWAPDACGSTLGGVDLGGVTGAAQILVDINADAPGDDGVNLNGEWVRFTNTGADTVDLDGWVVADESASHRYRFSDLQLDPGWSVTLFSGCGSDDESSRFWCTSGSAIWNNSGDTVFLRDSNGNIAVSLSYGSSAP